MTPAHASTAAPRAGRPPAFPPEMLRQRIAVVRALLAQAEDLAGSDCSADPAGWHAHFRQHLRSLAALMERDHAARFREHNGCHFVHMLGLEASATAGPAEALRNWCNAAERRMRAA